jgi:hypothetical protein
MQTMYLVPLNLIFPATLEVVDNDVQVTESGDDTTQEPVPKNEPATHIDATEFHKSPLTAVEPLPRSIFEIGELHVAPPSVDLTIA